MILETPRLRLRRWLTADRQPFARLNADREVMAHVGPPLDREASDALAVWAERGLARDGHGLWAVEVREGRRFAGFVGLNRPDFEAPFLPAVEVGWRLARWSWGRGYATEGAEAALEVAFMRLDLPEVVAFTVPANARSRAVMDRVGMTHDPAGDFEHPRVATGDPRRFQFLYRLSRLDWLARRTAA